MCSNEGRNTKKNQDKYMDSWSAGTDKWDRPTAPRGGWAHKKMPLAFFDVLARALT